MAPSPPLCRCPCDALTCAHPERFAPASEQEQVELVAEIACVASALSGRFALDRGRLLLSALRLLPGLRHLDGPGLDRLLARAVAHSERGVAWLCESAHRIRSAPLRRVGFRLAAMLSVDDEGLIAELPQELLLVLASGFGFDAPAALSLLEQATGRLDEISP